MADRNLRILWFGTLLNFAGVTMNMTAQGVVAFNLTGNSRAVGEVMLAGGLSMLLIAPFAGAFADRLPKRTLLIGCQMLLGSSFLSLGLAITFDIINIPILAVSAFINGTMFATIRSVRNAYIGELAAPEMRGNAVAIQQLAMTIMQIGGPFMAALLLGWSVTGAAGTYYVMTGAFCFAIMMMYQLPATKAPERRASPTSHSCRDSRQMCSMSAPPALVCSSRYQQWEVSSSAL